MLLKREEEAIFSLRELYASRGYRPFKMSRFEEYDLYVRNKEFLVSDRVITFTDRSGKLMALKPDVTLSIVKNASDEPGVVQKYYYNESVFRADKNTQDFRELTQTGLECVGDLQPYDISEVVLMAIRSLCLLGDKYILDLSHMGLLEAILADVPQEDKKTVAACLQQKNLHEIKALCKNLNDATFNKLSCLIDNAGPADKVLPQIISAMDKEEEFAAISQLQEVLTVLAACGLDKQVRIDFSVANGMGYYNGLVFRGYLANIPDAILSGGQYDRLPARLGKRSRAIGFAIYLDLLERLAADDNEFDVDTVLLCKKGANVLALNKAAEKLSAEGTVLVCAEIPKNYRARKVYVFANGEVKAYDRND